MAHVAAQILKGMGHKHASFVGHSYGTFVISRIRQLYPEVRFEGNPIRCLSNFALLTILLGFRVLSEL